MSVLIKKVRNAVSLQHDNLRINVEINHPNYGWIPYTIDPADTDTTIDNNEVMGLIGENFATYVAPTQSELYEIVSDEVREQRNRLLATSDWTQVADAPVDQAAWATYRQSLRDITDQVGFPENVDWPVPPTQNP